MCLLECIEPPQVCGDRELERAALIANRLAKLACGQTRRLLYRIKDRCLLRLYRRESLVLNVDVDCHPGLLSAHLRLEHRTLHTHENWLLASYRNRVA